MINSTPHPIAPPTEDRASLREPDTEYQFAEGSGQMRIPTCETELNAVCNNSVWRHMVALALRPADPASEDVSDPSRTDPHT